MLIQNLFASDNWEKNLLPARGLLNITFEGDHSVYVALTCSIHQDFITKPVTMLWIV